MDKIPAKPNFCGQNYEIPWLSPTFSVFKISLINLKKIPDFSLTLKNNQISLTSGHHVTNV